MGDLRATSGYLELEHALPFGAFLAGRWDLLRYGDLVGSDGLARPWDHPLTRIEAGAGYRISREARAKLVVQRTAIERGAGVERRHTLVAAQLSLGF